MCAEAKWAGVRCAPRTATRQQMNYKRVVTAERYTLLLNASTIRGMAANVNTTLKLGMLPAQLATKESHMSAPVTTQTPGDDSQPGRHPQRGGSGQDRAPRREEGRSQEGPGEEGSAQGRAR